MNKKEKSEKVLKIIGDIKNSSNKDLMLVMDTIQEDFEFTKKIVIDSTLHLDKLELTYNTVLKEYQKRTKINENR
jgi:hypothetical protein